MEEEYRGAAEPFRTWGYLQADLDPLGRLPARPHPELDAHPDDRYRRVYCGSIGVEFMHMPDPDRRRWVQERMESPPPEPDRERILDRLLRADVFEKVLQTRYVGTRRYSLEGITALIPLLDEILEGSAARGAEEVLLAMAHRGRLNVIVHTVGRRSAEIFAGFEDFDPRSVLGGGDVKYHLGATGAFVSKAGRKLRVALASNPSHLEAVDAVMMGRARAKQERRGGPGKVVPVCLHGDAAFAGQGIAAETLNLAELEGFRAGGTIHVVLNNLVGFTTTPKDLHSSPFATDVAKRLPLPIFHVNGEDPEAVVRVAGMALGYRSAFGSDVVVDLIGYRRHGHSEVDDPTTTQPLLYRTIESIPPLWRSYAEATGLPADEEAVRREYEKGHEEALAESRVPTLREFPEYWAGYVGGPYDPSLEAETAVPAGRLREIGEALATTPEGFALHPKVRTLLEQRRRMATGERAVDWGAAEHLAFGSLLREGTPVRLAGQDSRRGTFNQRHSVLVDTATEEEYVPLRHVAAGQAPFGCFDTPLSEASALGFEYGFSRDAPEALVLWEAQFGDFANGAQVIIDQFVCSGEDKWGLLSGLVLLLPHGFEGQGPEHSSARLERFLQLSAEDNIQVCQPSTAAQYFHLLRRQARRAWRKPLVVMTPKSLLRNPSAASPLEALSEGRFEPVLADPDVAAPRRVLVCSGKVAYELRAERERRHLKDVAIVRLEQLYPFPGKALARAIGAAREVLWVQEEPANMGGLGYALPLVQALVPDRYVRTVKRSASASPSTGSAKAHGLEQASLLALALAG